jgi:ligand-binding sensor domain-containing protein
LDGASWETVFSCGEHLPRGKVLDIAFTPDGAAWIANGFGLASFDGQEWTTYEGLINSLVVAPDGVVWMNGWEGTQGSFCVARFDGESWSIFKGTDSYPGGFLVGAVTPDGLLWGTVGERRLASFDGLSWGDEGSWTLYSRADGLALDEVLSVAVAPDGALWVGTTYGAARFDGAWTAYTTGHVVRAIAFGPEGEVWLETTVIHPARAG